jgi:hypothetical protein
MDYGDVKDHPGWRDPKGKRHPTPLIPGTLRRVMGLQEGTLGEAWVAL